MPRSLGTGLSARPVDRISVTSASEPTDRPAGGSVPITNPAAIVSLACSRRWTGASFRLRSWATASSGRVPASSGIATASAPVDTNAWIAAPRGVRDPASGTWPATLPAGTVGSGRSACRVSRRSRARSRSRACSTETPLMDGTSTSRRPPCRKSSIPRRSATVSAANAAQVVRSAVRKATSPGRPMARHCTFGAPTRRGA